MTIPQRSWPSSEAPEARTAYAHYPLSYRTRPVMTVPYRITYRVVQR